jgi:acyl dehydratase
VSAPAASVVDPSTVGAQAAPSTRSWDSTDCLLYALGVGAGADELAFTTENTRDFPQRVLPTMAAILGVGPSVLRLAGSIKLSSLVHGDEEIELAGEIPAEGTLVATSTITGIFDKGRHALVNIETVSVDAATGAPLFTVRAGLIVRGAGGFGEGRGVARAAAPAVPDHAPDLSVTYRTSPDQALLYRLSGDRNPLHSDPSFAARAGFDRPILHGLCTYGLTGRALLHALCDSDPARLQTMSGRFSAPVLPGDKLTIDIWRLGGSEAAYRTTASPDGRTVIDRGYVTVTQ